MVLLQFGVLTVSTGGQRTHHQLNGQCCSTLGGEEWGWGAHRVMRLCLLVLNHVSHMRHREEEERITERRREDGGAVPVDEGGWEVGEAMLP